MKSKMIIGALCCSLLFAGSYAQSPKQTTGGNWIKTKTLAGDSTMVTDIQYFNGLGLLSQSVSVKNTPSGKDLVVPVEYDGVLRSDARSYLPYPAADGSGVFRTDAFSRQAQYYGNVGAYSTKEYETSPLNRVCRSAMAGNLGQDGSVKYVTYSYESNASNEVLKLTVDESSNALTIAGYYSGSILLRTKRVDEDGHTTAVYTNLEGQILLTRAYNDNGIPVDTYNVYDNAGRLRWVISPEGAAQLGTSGTLSSADARAKEYCYLYTYDARGNITEKRMPGREPDYLVYDSADRLVMSQDGNQRADGNRWLLIRYDAHDRMISQQTLPSSLTRNELTAIFASGQSSTLYDSAAAQLESRHIYDLTQIDSSVQFTAVSDVVSLCYGGSTNRLVYEELRVLGEGASNQFVKRAYHYDLKGNLVQSATKHVAGNVTRQSYLVDFRGNVLKSVESSGVDNYMTRNFTYDSQGRLLSEVSGLYGQMDAGTTYQYDELGRENIRDYGIDISAATELRSYTIQGWLDYLTSNQFYFALSYNNPQLSGTIPSYTGNITECHWAHDSFDGQHTIYAFTYDGLSRLKSTKQYIDGVPNDQNIEKGLKYDLNGNIDSLQRYSAGALSDDFKYSYTGNRLTSLSGSSTGNYAYDSNGNITHDGANNLDLTYNRLNLLEKVERDGITLAKYRYLSDGTKLSALNSASEGLAYYGSFTYRQTSGGLAFESVPFNEGRFVAANGYWEPRYFLRDHLGSVRVVINDSGDVLERNDYYPFGMRWNGGELTDNRYRYNGKEEQSFVNLPYLDYGARMYDPRFRLTWGGVDLMLEKRTPLSPFVFCGNNPVNFVDPNGMDYYQSASGSVVWQDNNKLRIVINDEVYKNIGAAYSQQLTDGSYVNFYQGIYISSSEEAIDARQSVLENIALSGWLLSKSSPLGSLAQQDLMRDLIHNAQGNFLAGAAEFTASALQSGGDVVATGGYAMSATGAGAGAGAPLVVLGNGMKYAGIGIEAAVEYLRGNKRKVLYTGFTSLTMYGIGAAGNMLPIPNSAIFNLLLTPFNAALDYGGSTMQQKKK